MYCPDLASADFYLFSQLKSTLKVRHFSDATDIFRNATDKLNRISQNWFQECFQRLYNCRQKSIDVKGEYFEGNVTTVIYFSVILRNKLIPGIFCSYHVDISTKTSHYLFDIIIVLLVCMFVSERVAALAWWLS